MIWNHFANTLFKIGTIAVSQPSVLSLSTSYTIPPCDSPSGTITASASGGTGPYTFSINGNVTNTGFFDGLMQGLNASFNNKYYWLILYCRKLHCYGN